MEQTLERRIAAELRAELARQDHTGRWLADVTGISVSSVARYIKGTRAPGVNELDAMCLALGMSVADLLQRVEVTGGYDRAAIPLQRGPMSLAAAEHTDFGSEG